MTQFSVCKSWNSLFSIDILTRKTPNKQMTECFSKKAIDQVILLIKI